MGKTYILRMRQTKREVHAFWKDMMKSIMQQPHGSSGNMKNRLESINCNKTKIRKLDTQMSKLLKMYGALHSRADIDRLYIHRKEGGMVKIASIYKIGKVGMNNYVRLKEIKISASEWFIDNNSLNTFSLMTEQTKKKTDADEYEEVEKAEIRQANSKSGLSETRKVKKN